MNNYQKISFFLLRLSLGWLMFYAGITKVLNPEWTAKGYLESAKSLTVFYAWLASPNILPIIDFIAQWGLTVLGVSLILGIGVRLFSYFGAILMLLFYLPKLEFPYPNAHSFIVDEHIIYTFVFIFLGASRAGRILGLEKWFSNLPILKKLKKTQIWFG